MQDFYSDRTERFDSSISIVGSERAPKSVLAEKLAEFEKLDLSAEDEGFLRLAKTILEPVEEPISRPVPDWEDDGLIS